jgi:hypothetical protein
MILTKTVDLQKKLYIFGLFHSLTSLIFLEIIVVSNLSNAVLLMWKTKDTKHSINNISLHIMLQCCKQLHTKVEVVVLLYCFRQFWFPTILML